MRKNAGVIDALIQEAKAQGKTGPGESSSCTSGYHGGRGSTPSSCNCEGSRSSGHGGAFDQPQGIRRNHPCRENGQTVFAETCPQYLLLDDSVYSKPDFEGAKYVCAPPIRKKEDQDCLWKALADGDIQTVATDQCSFTLAQKAMGKADFTKIPGGLPGVQTRELFFTLTACAPEKLR